MVEVRFKSDYEKIEEIKLKFRGAELWKALLRIKAGFTEFC